MPPEPAAATAPTTINILSCPSGYVIEDPQEQIGPNTRIRPMFYLNHQEQPAIAPPAEQVEAIADASEPATDPEPTPMPEPLVETWRPRTDIPSHIAQAPRSKQPDAMDLWRQHRRKVIGDDDA